MSIAFLFPGRGSQRPGMLHRLPDTAASATVLAEADWALRRLASRPAPPGPGGAGPAAGREYADGIAELDTAEALEHSPVACHVALLVAGVAGAGALREDEGVEPAFVAGEDVGGYAAAVVAGVLTLEEALRAVRLRGQLLERAEEPVGDIGIRLAQHLATVRRRPQEVPYVSGMFGRSLRGDTNAVFEDLARSVAEPAPWGQVAGTLAAAGTVCCVELPPGRALTGRTIAAAPSMRAVSVEEHGLAEAAETARSAAGAGRPAGSAAAPADAALPEEAPGGRGAEGRPADVPPPDNPWGGQASGHSGLA